MTNHYQIGYDEGTLAAREGQSPKPNDAENFPTNNQSGEREEFLAGYEQGYQDAVLDHEHIHKQSHHHGHGSGHVIIHNAVHGHVAGRGHGRDRCSGHGHVAESHELSVASS